MEASAVNADEQIVIECRKWMLTTRGVLWIARLVLQLLLMRNPFRGDNKRDAFRIERVLKAGYVAGGGS